VIDIGFSKCISNMCVCGNCPTRRSFDTVFVQTWCQVDLCCRILRTQQQNVIFLGAYLWLDLIVDMS
jgi:hypothetical protein